MFVTLHQPARARLITPERQERDLTVTLRYDADDPLAVQVVFPVEVSPNDTEVIWTFGRELLEKGLRIPTGCGDVHIWPCGRARTVLEVHAPEGMALVQFDEAVLRRFLRRTYTAVPAGQEDLGPAVERGLSALFA
ncbi:SsgA family sporulation/cell division regulator [Streptomyces sp. NPDC091292]|uniref:SsgA family sporulation/cell division regulator n=1 Tax=Streptomyces sp. NPDC091292 TaxID=3365991 RepID=UPI0038143CAB